MEETLKIREYILGYMGKCDYPTEAVETFLCVFDKIVGDESISAMFFKPVWEYRDGQKIEFRKFVSDDGLYAQIGTLLSVSRYTTSFLFALALLPYLQKRYEKANIGLDIFYNSTLDLKYKLLECKKMYNVWGSFVTYWFDRWFFMTRFTFGRVQFEPMCHNFVPTIIDKKPMLLRPYIMMHIPSSGPLNHDEVLMSYKEAYEFFRPQYGDKISFVIGSWLLNPDHEKFLPQSSNIRQFMGDFRRVYVLPELKNEDFWRIFYKEYSKETLDIPATTTLQKEYLKLLKSGHHIKLTVGTFLYTKDGIKK